MTKTTKRKDLDSIVKDSEIPKKSSRSTFSNNPFSDVYYQKKSNKYITKRGLDSYE